MTPLDAAQKVYDAGPPTGVYCDCVLCGGSINVFGEWEHGDDCPWLHLPAIIAALEREQRLRAAVERIVSECEQQIASQRYPQNYTLADYLTDYTDDGHYSTCYGCGAESAPDGRLNHRPECGWLRVLAALRAEQPAGQR